MTNLTSKIHTRSKRLNSNSLNIDTKSYADVTKLKLIDVNNSKSKQITTKEIIQTERKTVNHCFKPTSESKLIYPKKESKTILHVDEMWLEDAIIEAYLKILTEYIKIF